jgi:hypothetical protein
MSFSLAIAEIDFEALAGLSSALCPFESNRLLFSSTTNERFRAQQKKSTKEVFLPPFVPRQHISLRRGSHGDGRDEKSKKKVKNHFRD